MARLGSSPERCYIHIYLGLVRCTQTERRKTNTCETKRPPQTKQAQHLLGGELCLPWWKEVSGLFCGLTSATLNSSHVWIPHYMNTKIPCVIFGSCWALSQRYWRGWSLKSEPQICWNSAGIVSWTDSIRKIKSVSGLGFLSCQRYHLSGNKHKAAKLISDSLLLQQ